MLRLRADYTNSLGPATVLDERFDADTCNAILSKLKSLHPARWVKRTSLSMHRAASSDASCSYKSVLNRSFDKDTLAYLISIAPEFEGARLAEVVSNFYAPGDYIPLHQDVHQYRFNLVVNLEDSDVDGIVIENTRIFDKAGQLVLFKYAGLLHEVPPVINNRYILIYLYEPI